MVDFSVARFHGESLVTLLAIELLAFLAYSHVLNLRRFGDLFVGDYPGCLLDWKFQRVAPYGSDVPKAKIVSGFTSYTCHGGGPALGALYAAVSPPLTTVGFHPSSVKASAIRVSLAGSTILLAGPSATRSKSCVAIVMTLFGLRAMFRALRVFGPAVK